jgi:hypothetical protein
MTATLPIEVKKRLLLIGRNPWPTKVMLMLNSSVVFALPAAMVCQFLNLLLLIALKAADHSNDVAQ